MSREHRYPVLVRWTGNTGSGTSGYRDYSRDHEVVTSGPGALAASSDPAFRGDGSRWNPEQLFVASISECHMLWYLHLATNAGLVVDAYEDDALGVMREDASGGGGEFAEVVLRPRVRLTAGDVDTANAIHGEVHRYCFIARSVSVPIRHEPTAEVVR
jgi:organic hydroperoxide reductase OsmC/OhrA